MLSGFNTNVRHRSTLFHVQSEDSGRAHPHVITHLYYRGTILASEKTSYADQVDATDLPSVVKALMERQHKAVLRRLVSGGFDHLIRERLGTEALGEPGPPDLTHSDADSSGASRPAAGETAPEPLAAASATPDPQMEPTLRDPRSDRSFGAGVVSERPLDEVILDYLVESARQRKRRAQ
jgi:hypothetical protein